MNTTDLSTCDLANCRLKLSDDLVFAPQSHADLVFYHVEAPSKGRFFRIGYPEYVFVSLLDGQTTLAQAITISARALGDQALTQPMAMEVATWLLTNGLARLADQPESAQQETATSASQSANPLRHLNPFWIKIPLCRPDQYLARLLPYVSWLFSPLATCVGLVLMCLGVMSVATHWDGFVASSHLIFSPHNWLLMALVWVGLKVIHELAHALVCKRYGGEVRDTGVIFILLAPAAFVDVTSSWRFTSKWKRIHVAAAGMYVELVVAAIAAMMWRHVDSTLIRHLLFNAIVMASVSTLVFNANPLMRFDGYYILADLLEIPNLATEGGRFVHQLAARVFLGRLPSAKQLIGTQGWVVRTYGVAAWFWRLFVCVSLIGAASVLFKGAGIALGIFGAVCWFGTPLIKTAAAMRRLAWEAPLQVLRASVVSGVLGCIAYAILVWVPWPAAMTAPIVVEYNDLSIVRSRAPGFVHKIHVHDGTIVDQGDLLLELTNDDLRTEFRELQSLVAQSKLQHRAALNEHDAAGAQIALRTHQAQVDRLKELQAQVDGLRVYAPIAGRVVARELDDVLGTYVTEGTELLAVGDEARKELSVSVSHDQIDDVTHCLGQPVRFRTGNLRVYPGTLTRLEPRASRQLPHPALSAEVGGPLVVGRSGDEDDRDSSVMVEPRFPGVITVPADVSPHLACGQRGYAILGYHQESISAHLWNRFSRWLHQLSKLRRQSG